MTIFQQLLVSFGLGLLLGLERERTERSIAGIRTFPLISLFGTVCAQVGQVAGGWVTAAGLLALTSMVIFANLARLRTGVIDPGMTTEIAALLLYAVGALVVLGHMPAAVMVGGAMLVLLHAKEPLHRFARAVGARDMVAISQFVLISLIILPVLPNRPFGPYGVWNPFKLWLMVVLIVGISLCGYVAYKLFGGRAGTVLGGMIGGLISSTATTASFARRSSGQPRLAPLAAFVIMIASCISITRILVEIATVASAVFWNLAPPLLCLLLVSCAIAGALFFFAKEQKAAMPEQNNPAQFRSALAFGLVYAIVLLGVAVAREHFGSAGLFVVGAISGLTDVDAITLTTAQLAGAGNLDIRLAWQTILIAILANFLFKFLTVAVLASRALTGRVGAAFGAAMAAGGAVFLLWPE